MEFLQPCNLLQPPVVLGSVQRFLKKFLNDCNLGLKAVVIEGQDTNKKINIKIKYIHFLNRR